MTLWQAHALTTEPAPEYDKSNLAPLQPFVYLMRPRRRELEAGMTLWQAHTLTTEPAPEDDINNLASLVAVAKWFRAFD